MIRKILANRHHKNHNAVDVRSTRQRLSCSDRRPAATNTRSQGGCGLQKQGEIARAGKGRLCRNRVATGCTYAIALIAQGPGSSKWVCKADRLDGEPAQYY